MPKRYGLKCSCALSFRVRGRSSQYRARASMSSGYFINSLSKAIAYALLAFSTDALASLSSPPAFLASFLAFSTFAFLTQSSI